MRKNFLLALFIFLAFPLIGVGCNNQNELVNKQQKQIEDLTKKVEEIQASPNLAVTTTLNSDSVLPTTTPTVKKQVADSVVQSTKQVPSPTQQVLLPAQPVAEENFSNVLIKVIASQQEVIQDVRDNIKQTKNVVSGIKQMWTNELTRTQVYLGQYPNDATFIRDAKLIDLLAQLSDNRILILNEKDQQMINVQGLLKNLTATFQNAKVTRSEMQDLLTQLIKVGDAIKTYIVNLDTSNNEFMANNNKYAIILDAWHNVEIAKNQQYINDLNQLQAQADRVVATGQASLNQIQNTINSLNYSKPAYCTATNLGAGSISVVCQ